MQCNRVLALLFLLAFAAPCSASDDEVALSDEEMIDAVEAGNAAAFESEAMYDSTAIESDMDELPEEEPDTTDEPDAETTATSTEPVNTGTQGTQGTEASSSSTSEPTKTRSTTTGSSTTSSESTSTSSKSSSSSLSSSTTTAAPAENATSSSSSTTTTTTTALIEGSLSFEVTGGNASDLVDDFENDTDGSVASALATSIASGADGVEPENVTILSVELDSTNVRLLRSANLRSSRALQGNPGIVVQYHITVPAGQDGAAVVAALTSTGGVAAIEDALTTELQAVDPSLTIGSVEVVAEVVEATTATTTVTDRESFAHRPMNSLASIMLACTVARFLLQ